MTINDGSALPQARFLQVADYADNYGGSTVVKAGRPQGGPRGQSEQANELAGFLRDLTKDFTVRELAGRYKISKTSWGEYRAGTKTIHLHLLKRLVHDMVRDERSRTARWAMAQRLHAQAVAAQQPAALAQPAATDAGVTPKEAAEQAIVTLQGAERLVHMLLGVIAGLQMQPTAPGDTRGEVTGSAPPPAAQDTQAARDLREAEHRLVQVRLVQSAVTRVRDEALSHHPDSDPEPGRDSAKPGTGAAEGGRPGDDDAALPARYAVASPEAAAILIVSRAALVEQYAATRLLSARAAGADTGLYTAAASTPALPAPPHTVPPGASDALWPPDRSQRWRTVRVVAVVVALTAVLSGAAVVTALGLRDRGSPQAHETNSPAPVADAPRTSPTPSRSAPTSAAPSPTPSAPRSASPSARAKDPGIRSVPDSYIGAWQGEFTEPGEQGASLRRVVLRKGDVGTEIADVMTLSRTSLCQARGTLRSADTLLVITPKATSGTPTDLCTPAGDITLRRHGDAGLTWTSDGTTVTLHRTTSPSRAVPAQFVGTWRAQDGSDPTSSVRMTIKQGSLGHARAEFTWDGDAHNCKGFSVLAFADDVLKFGPETVTASEPEGFCTPTPSRIVSRPHDGTMHVEWVTPPDGTAPRSFTFTRSD